MKADSPIRTIDQLTGFPFNKFEDFQTAYNASEIQVGVDRTVAHKWVQQGLYCPKHITILAFVLLWIPLLVSLSLVVYLFVTRSWWYLLSIPFVIASYFVFYPHPITRHLRAFISILILFVVMYSIYAKNWNLLALSSTILIIYLSIKVYYALAISALTKALVEHEDLLCTAWSSRFMSLIYPDGTMYWMNDVSDRERKHYYTHDLSTSNAANILVEQEATRQAELINDYFANAVRVYALTNQEDAKIAAIAAGKLAAREQRESMIKYLGALIFDFQAAAPDSPDVQSCIEKMTEVRNYLQEKDWSIRDIVHEKNRLRKQNAEYLDALENYDPEIFERKHPDIFKEQKK